ncbi:MAG: AI-2E family transporter [Alphaproteobacteria bacterium]|nr:AI-2E family transporter [Alphaproteobacteria bacterium]
MSDFVPSRVGPLAAGAVVAALTIFFLVQGRDLLIPITIAIVIWYLLNALADFFDRIPRIGERLPHWLTLVGAVIIVLILVALVAELISDNLSQVAAAAPAYQANFEKLVESASRMAGFEEPPDITRIVEEINVRALIAGLAATVAAFAGSFGIVLVYVLFLLIEQGSFSKKLNALFPDPQKRSDVSDLLHRMQDQIKSYVAIKTLASIMTGLISYAILAVVGVDFAAFWGFVIFLLNYIPTIGSLLGILLPTLLAVVQFASPAPVLAVLVGGGLTQFVIGNIVEPKLMGNSLNISPLVVLISLAVWGSIWGLAGMFLSVPLTMIAMIVFSYFRTTRPIAIILSGDGDIETRHST